MDSVTLHFVQAVSVDECRHQLAKHFTVEGTVSGDLVAIREKRVYIRWVSADGEMLTPLPQTVSPRQGGLLAVEYSSVAEARNVLKTLLMGRAGTVDLDFGLVMSFDEFLARCESEPEFSWRI